MRITPPGPHRGWPEPERGDMHNHMNTTPKAEASPAGKPGRTPSFAVTATVREPAELVLAFVAHHLELGAKKIIIYLDDPDDPVRPLLVKTPRVNAIRCTEAYWNEVTNGRGRPPNQNARQAVNASQAYKKVKADYLLHLDADEFLHMARPFAEEIARLEDDDVWLRVPAVERCWLEGDASDHIFSGVFRHPIKQAPLIAKRIYGEEVTPFLANGLAGSSHGKPLVRTGHKVQVQVHAAKLPGKNNGWAKHKKATGLHVLHFDGLTPLHWAAKTLRYAEQGDEAIDKLLHQERARQVREVRDNISTMPELLRFFRKITGLTPDQSRALTEHGRLSAMKIDPEAAMRRVFPEVEADFSFRAFDLKLGSENAKRLMKKIAANQAA
ncbi:glycosyltransferase family 2 protein [Oceanicola sp. D3]|uniref:glycosyltransferase family 2 protein n=1 Tax=Oceanicola sp. D3 TaxID=2587163 RepID=UPI0011233FAF|nr:glycosyltransferase family 2 protein [Oceanicola sp. D3]QDC08784.1 glycosyltransferase family 2 protein [Oceanicola sp. D3]